MQFDLKKELPIILVGAGVLGALYFFSQSQSAQASAVAPIDTTGTIGGDGSAAGTSGGTATPASGSAVSLDPTTYLSALSQLYGESLSANANTQSTGANEYETYLAAMSHGLDTIANSQNVATQADAATTIANAQKPSFLQQLTNFVAAAGSAAAPFVTPGAAFGKPIATPNYSSYPTRGAAPVTSVPATVNPFTLA